MRNGEKIQKYKKRRKALSGAIFHDNFIEIHRSLRF